MHGTNSEPDVAPPVPLTSFRFLEVLDDALEEDTRADLADRVRRALDDFPALSGETVTLARLKPSKEYIRGDPNAVADPYNRVVFVPTDGRMTNMTLYHELAHLEIRVRVESGVDLPETSEEFCSLYAVARMPVERIDRESIAYIGTPSVPCEEWPTVAERALEYRERRRNYIQKAKEWFGV